MYIEVTRYLLSSKWKACASQRSPNYMDSQLFAIPASHDI